ncbi:acetoin dehydrogenase operon transcriptional activator AcoR [Thalassobacillus devorans]|uniref:Acetoin dehydrogenase operon transcriptional activator AcoR n=1 Tax=Thalassobacillus devorans TaxID=279813 RepID=A0ABQ1PRH5_9BACI|nr:sigma-54-dependent Fis family transcriptional regulator [Thalassobacillus devorans]NIK30574.1 transcriptional regulator of acetoin/glycerol metabolism [Thalassobacillus devorans]GGD01822.1 acetoin dehydrogenase operon transcriptional activator AcoR [Thalassobacillus devorans]
MVEQITKGDWRRFVQEGVLDNSRINERIRASWNHCRRLGVDPYNGKGTQMLSYDALQKRRRENSWLIELAEPFIKKLATMYHDSNVILLLVDREGYVLRMAGEELVKATASQINFTEGVKWTEEQVGTNAIGTALAIGEPIAINGMEHFSVASQTWGCSAAPIKDENGDVIGALDISSPFIPDYYQHVLATVVAAAYAIESMWQHRMKEEELELINLGLKEERGSDRSFILYNRNHQLVYASSAITNIPAAISELPTNHNKSPVYGKDSSEIIGHQITLTNQKKSPAFQGWNSSFQFQGVAGKSSTFQKVLERAKKAAEKDVTIHITGDTGTGKEVMAKSLHVCSKPDRPFVAVNCGAIPENLLESELFGYTGGAFTGAQRNGYEGKIVQANGGTLFLDEIGDISVKTQVALLRTLQEKKVVPIGGKKPIPVSFRLITATNKSLGGLVKKGQFREDLYYRIYVYPLHMPPLKNRLSDIPELVDYYFQKRNWQFTWRIEAIRALQSYHWPGNIRELFNVLEGIYTEYGEQSPEPSDVEAYIRQITPHERDVSFSGDLSTREQMEKEYIEKALKQHGGKASAAARQLGIPRSTFYRKLKKYELG